MRTLIPPSVTAQAEYATRRGALFGFALTPRALWLLAAGLLFAVPAFFRPHTVWMMPAWDVVVLLLCAVDLLRLPKVRQIEVTRRFENAPFLGKPLHVIVELAQRSRQRLRVGVLDGLHPALDVAPRTHFVMAYPNEPVSLSLEVLPARRGDLELDRVYLRCRTMLGLAERWAAAPVQQPIRVMPSAIGVEDESLFLMRARQIELEKRRLRKLGLGREFEALRDYQAGDELRAISWTATARRGKLITRTFTTERSQQVWTVIDAGRLSRTTFEVPLKGRRGRIVDGSEGHNEERLHLQQVDQATSAGVLLSQVVDRAGDRSGVLAYGRAIQQQIQPGRGALHLRRIVDALSVVHAERAEADHRRASARLRQLQSTRSLVFWITEMAESVSMPEVALAVSGLASRHLVVLVLLEHPELEEFARRQPKNASEMFAITAANEMLARRRGIVSQLERQGVLIVETSPEKVGVSVINRYLEIKSRGAL